MAIVENRIFVNGVPQSAKKEDLSTYFSAFGPVIDLHVPWSFGGPQSHKGICFVTFGAHEATEAVLGYHGHAIHGQPITCEQCLAKKGQGKGASLPGTAGSTEDRIFISQIPPECTQDEVQVHFAKFGSWTDFYMPKGTYPAGHKGICFISFEDKNSIALVMESGPHEIHGQRVVVDAAAPREGKGGCKGGGKGFAPQNVYTPPGVQTTQYTQQPAGGYYQPNPAVYVPPAAVNPPVVRPPVQGGVVPGRLFLTGMTPGLTKEDLTLYFAQYGDLADVYIPPGKNIGFVGFIEPSVAEVVQQVHTHVVKDGYSVNVEAAVERSPMPGKGGAGKARYEPYG